MHQATRAGNAEIAKAILPIDIRSHRRCAQPRLAGDSEMWYDCHMDNLRTYFAAVFSAAAMSAAMERLPCHNAVVLHLPRPEMEKKEQR